MKNLIIHLCFCSLLFISCSSDDDNTINYIQPPQNQIIDSRDNKVYKTVQIGTQTWFAENLNYDTGDDSSECYDDEASNCFIYGRLYKGDQAQVACPTGWHLPTVAEWQILFDFLGGTNTAHVFLAPGASLQGNLVNFNLLAAGQKFITYVDLNDIGNYWTATDGGFPNSFKNLVYIPDTSVSLNGVSSASIMKSCRCVKD